MATTRPGPATSQSRTAVVQAPAVQAPAPYAPMAHPGRPRSWKRESIVAALRAWVEETGAAPRRSDWSGERPGRAGDAQRKWMREHPRWPSSSCVATHFGSWSKALTTAGLDTRCLTFEDTVAERIETAWRLRADGQRIHAIAEHVGVSVSTVHNYLRAGSCPQCGGPVASPRATCCIACTAPEPTIQSAWTRDSVRDAIRTWTVEHGQPPSYHERTPYRSAPSVWKAQSPRWPSAAVVCHTYREHPNPWNSALLDAGTRPRFKRWSDDAIRDALGGFWTRTGRAPALSDLRASSWQGPSAATLRRRYGNLDQAWQALGPVPTPAVDDAKQSPAPPAISSRQRKRSGPTAATINAS
jgi:hypothetical protein